MIILSLSNHFELANLMTSLPVSALRVLWLTGVEEPPAQTLLLFQKTELVWLVFKTMFEFGLIGIEIVLDDTLVSSMVNFSLGFQLHIYCGRGSFLKIISNWQNWPSNHIIHHFWSELFKGWWWNNFLVCSGNLYLVQTDYLDIG